MSKGTPEYLIPRMGENPVSSSRFYQTATITNVYDEKIEQGKIRKWGGPLTIPTPEETALGFPAEGVLLTHEQSWIIKGTALGPLLHSVCLAPGEVTQIAVVNHSQKVAEASVDQGIQNENLEQQGQSEGQLDESQQSAAKESGMGTSTASATSSSMEAGGGGILGGLGVSAGGASNTASSNTANFSLGNREVSASSNQKVHQRASDQAQLSRSRHTASIREVKEHESVEMKTRVLANYNHMHALTMMYFEVEQVYELQTGIHSAERLLFIPLKPIDFSVTALARKAIRKYRKLLIEVAEDLGLQHLADKLNDKELIDEGAEAEEKEREKLEEELNAALEELENTAITLKAARQRILEARDVLKSEIITGEGSMVSELSFAKGEKTVLETFTIQEELKNAIKTEKSEQLSYDRQIQVVKNKRRAIEIFKRKQAVKDAKVNIDELELHTEMYDHNMAFNQGLWLRFTPTTTMPFFYNKRFKGERLGSTIDPNPVCVAGNYLGFRWYFSKENERINFEKKYKKNKTLKKSIALPTGGIFGEAVLGTSNGAEKIDLTRFWNWSDALPPIRPTEIEALNQPQSLNLQMPTRPGIPNAQIQQGPLKFPQLTSGIPNITSALANPDLFRDLSGKETAAMLAQSALENAKKGTEGAGELAAKNFQRYLKLQEKVANTLLDSNSKDGGKFDINMAGGKLNAIKESEADEDEPEEPLEEIDETDSEETEEKKEEPQNENGNADSEETEE